MTKDTLEYWLKVVGYLQAKLKWCEEAVETASLVATSDTVAPAAKMARFWQLYWGVMGLVENEQVTQAMIGFGNALTAKESPDMLKGRSIALAHACRSEMADSWSPVWKRSR